MSAKLKLSRIVGDCNEIERILKKLSLLDERKHNPARDFDAAEYRNRKYAENWQAVIRSNVYDFLLTDNSVFLFNKEKISFSYIECPYRCLSYDEFLAENDLREEEDGKGFYDYYEEYLTQCEIKDNFNPIRYDFDSNSYISGVHPVSHLHIGYNNEVRIGMRQILTPLGFFLFVLRQHYPASWREFLKLGDWKNAYKEWKSKLDDVEGKFWNKLDKQELFLS